MLIRWMITFFSFSFACILLTLTNYWQIDHASQKVLFGHKIGSIWSFWLGYGVLMIPFNLIVSYIFYSIYHYGYNHWFHRVWIVQLTMWAASLSVVVIITWLWYGELPSKGTLVGAILLIAGALISAFWR